MTVEQSLRMRRIQPDVTTGAILITACSSGIGKATAICARAERTLRLRITGD